MKIINLQAENFKRLKVVSITPDGNVVQITGPNGSGKSSVLDAIYAALAGAAALPGKPVRSGADKAHIRLDLGGVIVTRKFTATGTTSLVVESSKGARYPSPQRLLDDLLGALTFDPLAFAKMEPAQQMEQVRKLVTLEVDVDALRGQNRSDFEKRTEVGRDCRRLEAQIAGITFPADTPREPLDTAAMVAQLEKAGEANTELERRRARREAAAGDVKRLRERVGHMQQELEDLEAQAEQKRLAIEETLAQATDLQKRIDSAEALPEPIDTSDLRQKISTADQTNKHVSSRLTAERLSDQLAAARTQVKALTEAMEARDAAIKQAITDAKMPVPGLSFAESEVTFNELPLSQASDAEKLRVSVAIAMAANPKLRVLRIKEGSLLDSKALALLSEIAAANDYQIWIERVDESGKVGVVMEDGAVHEAPAAEPPQQ